MLQQGCQERPCASPCCGALPRGLAAVQLHSNWIGPSQAQRRNSAAAGWPFPPPPPPTTDPQLCARHGRSGRPCGPQACLAGHRHAGGLCVVYGSNSTCKQAPMLSASASCGASCVLETTRTLTRCLASPVHRRTTFACQAPCCAWRVPWAACPRWWKPWMWRGQRVCPSSG